MEFGVAQSYRKQLNGNMLPNYPPLSVMTFTGMAYFYRTMISSDFGEHPLLWRILIKLPAIFADVAIVLLLYFLVQRWKGMKAGLIAATVFALHPAVVYTSAVWGQTDALYTLALFVSLCAAFRERWLLSGACATAAVLLKAQAVALFPLFLLLALWDNHRTGKMLIGATIVACAVLLPFAVHNDLPAVWNVFVHSVGYYPSLTQGAQNFWYSVYANSGKQDINLFFGLLQYRTMGLLLFASSATGLLFAVRSAAYRENFLSRNAAIVVVLACALLAQSFFLFNTEMHERYLFPFIVFGIPLLFTGATGIALYILISLCFLLNLLAILPFSDFDRAVYREFSSLSIALASAQVFLFVLTFLHVVRFARRYVHLPKSS